MKPTDETTAEVAAAYERGIATVQPPDKDDPMVKSLIESSRAGFEAIEEERNTRRYQWSTKVSAFLATEMGNDIPTDTLIPMLSDDLLGPHMEAIEVAGAATLAICDACEVGDEGLPGAQHDLIVIRLEGLPGEDPWSWIDNDEPDSYCPFGWHDTAEMLVRTAMSICERIYWPTSSERLKALSLRIIWPHGYTAEDRQQIEEKFKVGAAAPIKLVVRDPQQSGH